MVMHDWLFTIREGMPDWIIGFDVFAFQKSPDGTVGAMQPAEVRVLTKEEMKGMTSPPLMPVMTIDRPSAQNLMDELWKVGLRPSEGTGSAGAFAAVQKHLEDMRAIAFKKSGVEPPIPNSLGRR